MLQCELEGCKMHPYNIEAADADAVFVNVNQNNYKYWDGNAV